KQPDGTQKHLTDIEGERAIEFVNSCTDKQPFCLSLSFNAPHATDGAPQQYFWTPASDELYKEAIFPIPKTMTDEFFQQLPKFLKESESRIRFHWRFDEPQKYQTMVRGYYRMITDIDRVIGRLREALQQRGLDQKTVILFTADNGYFLGERGMADKWYLYEPSVRVPLIVYDPRATAERRGQTVDQTCLNVDLAPTLVDLAGLAIPTSYQGRSLRPVLDGSSPADWRTDFFYEHLFERANIPKSEGVRTQRFAYIRWFEQKPLVEELYDHLADPDEVHNLVDDPRYSATLDQLRKRTTALRDQYGGPFVSNLKPVKPAK
ncbi:MAG: Sulfatase, partial [Planctomycetaceae bacterium]|nr:Sulfatase [Planctomycetaceae bacterium]